MKDSAETNTVFEYLVDMNNGIVSFVGSTIRHIIYMEDYLRHLLALEKTKSPILAPKKTKSPILAQIKTLTPLASDWKPILLSHFLYIILNLQTTTFLLFFL